MKKSLHFAVAAIAGAMLASSAHAGIITQTHSLPLTTTDILGSTGTFTFDFFLSSGAPVGAVLNSVTLQMIVGETIQSLTATNTAAQAQVFDYTAKAFLFATGTGAPTADKNALASALGSPLNLISTGFLSYDPNETKTFAPPDLINTANTGVINAASIAPYNTSGTFNLGFTTLSSESFTGGGGNTSHVQQTKAQGTVTVIYNYTESSNAPEPATMALLGSALIGISLLGRKRLKR